MVGGGDVREKDADKAKKDQAKWDELLGLEDQEKTAEEVMLLKNAERAAAGLPPIEQMPPPPKSEAQAWSELLALEDMAVVDMARQAAAGKEIEVEEAVTEEAVTRVEELGDAEEAVTGVEGTPEERVEEGEEAERDGSGRVDYTRAADELPVDVGHPADLAIGEAAV